MKFKNLPFGAGLICLLAFLIRLGDVSKGLWYDEAVQFWSSAAPFSQVLSKVRFHSQDPPLYHLLLHFWLLLGREVYWMRLFSILCGVGAVLLVFFISKEIFKSSLAGFLSAFFFAFFPLQIYYSLEIKPYGLLILSSLFSFWFFLKLLASGSGKYLTLFSLFSLFSIYTHYSAVFLLVAYNFAYLIFRKHFTFSGKKWLGWQLAIFCLTLLLVPLTLRYQIGVASTMYGGVGSFSPRILFIRIKDVVFEYFIFGPTRELLPMWLTKIEKKVFALVFLGGVYFILREKASRIVGKLLIILLLSTIILFYLAELARIFPFGGRQMMVVSILFYPFLTALVWGLGKFSPPVSAISGLLILSLLWPFTPFGQIGMMSFDAGMGKVVSFIDRKSSPDDLILVDEGAHPLFSYYYRKDVKVEFFEREQVFNRDVLGLLRGRDYRQVWFVFTSAGSSEKAEYSRRLEEGMAKEYRLSEGGRFADSSIFLFERLN